MCAVIAKNDLHILKGLKSLFISSLLLAFTIGNLKWLSDLDKPCPGICFITVPILFLEYKLMHKFPNLETVLGSVEKDLVPITLWLFFLLTSNTGTVFILIPTLWNISQILFMK